MEVCHRGGTRKPPAPVRFCRHPRNTQDTPSKTRSPATRRVWTPGGRDRWDRVQSSVTKNRHPPPPPRTTPRPRFTRGSPRDPVEFVSHLPWWCPQKPARWDRALTRAILNPVPPPLGIAWGRHLVGHKFEPRNNLLSARCPGHATRLRHPQPYQLLGRWTGKRPQVAPVSDPPAEVGATLRSGAPFCASPAAVAAS